MGLTSEQEQLVVDNRKLVHYILQNKMGLTSEHPEYDEYASEGMIGLVKAASSFDKSKKIKFSTYASRCILNEMLMHRRKRKKHDSDIFLSEIISESEKGNGIEVGDLIPDERKNMLDEIIEQEMFIYAINVLLNCFTAREKCVVLYRLGGIRQNEISYKIKLARSYVSRIENIVYKKIRQIYQEQLTYEEVIKMTMSALRYEITFSTKETRKFNALFATLLQRMSADLPDFNLSFSKERIVLQLLRDETAFMFIAEIIQAMDEYNLNLTSDKNTFTEKHSNVQQIDSNKAPNSNDNSLDEEVEDYERELQDVESEVERDITDGDTQQNVDNEEICDMKAEELKDAETVDECNNAEIYTQQNVNAEKSYTVESNNSQHTETIEKSSIVEDNISQTAEIAETYTANKSSGTKNGTSKIKQIIEYISTLDSFKVTELAKIFKKTDIGNAVFTAKKKGLITAIRKGEYSVNKN